ncbi:hypothetical protein [Candidatus Leptofilum sp.]|uniref:hypothetical protein n=1 Tax=Candidatus Leptofilum sp. TaxID=3241576 RepID=UPI003B59820B
MKKEDPILADELNRRIEADLQGQQPPVSEAIQPEAELATRLINLAQDTHPDPDFVASLGSQLARRATQKRKSDNRANSPERPSFWQQLSQLFKEGTIMNRNKYLLGALGVLALVVVGAYVIFNRGSNDNIEPVADATGSEVQTDESVSSEVDEPATNPDSPDEATEVADLPPLPVLDGSGQASGLGGGGGGNVRPQGGGGSIAAESASLAADSSFIFTDPFSGTLFTLNTTLPTEPGLAPVLQNVPGDGMSLDAVRDLASRFGFTGQIYQEQYPVFEQEEGFPTFEPPIVYHLFDGPRSLIIDPWGVYYNDRSIENDFENPISFEAAVPIAEAFVQERGLLDFEYETMQLWGADVNFVRTINGQPTNQPEMTVGVSHDGRIYFVSYQVMRNAEIVGRYPLITAQEAWELLQSGVLENNIPYQYAARPELAIEEPVFLEDPAADLYQFWMREFAPGDEIHLYEWPIVFLPADGNGDPRIQIRHYVIQADTATLAALAERVGEQTHVWGQVGPDGDTIELTGWEPIEQINEPISGPGIISRSGDQVLFTNNDTGSVYIVPDAPADLEDGTEVYLFAWTARDLGLEYPAVDWENIDKIVNFPPDEELLPVEPPVEEPVFEPFTYESFTVNEVSLAYYTTYSWPTNDEGELRYEVQPTIIVQPTWKFSGETDTGDLVEFFVQAPLPEYLNR